MITWIENKLSYKHFEAISFPNIMWTLVEGELEKWRSSANQLNVTYPELRFNFLTGLRQFQLKFISSYIQKYNKLVAVSTIGKCDNPGFPSICCCTTAWINIRAPPATA